MIGLQEFALQHTQLDFHLIEPGGIRRQPVHLEGHPPVLRLCGRSQPRLQPFGGVGGAIVQNQPDGLHLPLASGGH